MARAARRPMGLGPRPAALGVLAVATLTACRHTPSPTPAEPPPSTARPAPAPFDPCAGDCRALAEATMERNQLDGLRLLRACIECPDATPSTFARVADLERSRRAPEAALTTLRTGTRAHPRAALLWQLRGRLALVLGQPREGLDALTRARALRPDDPLLATELDEARRRHGDAETKAAAGAAPLLEEAAARFEARDLDGAKDALEAALPLSADAPSVRADIHRRLGLVHLARGDHAAAKVAVEAGLSDAVRPGPTRAGLLLAHADALIALGDPNAALISASAAAEMAPADPLAHTNVAVARALRGEAKPAVAALRRAVDAGLPERITRAELLEIAAFERLARRPDFLELVDEAWPAPAAP